MEILPAQLPRDPGKGRRVQIERCTCLHDRSRRTRANYDSVCGGIVSAQMGLELELLAATAYVATMRSVRHR